ncbi:MauE/DoxX family redox-associated membrane protein [Streptomyces sp. NPDC051162]|uniref:MauE/DoxX family redox-associated membrane protein n=1 Tax=unclassified Streptomyces TaxID=2593676 RepID=UPI0034218F37
MGCLALAIRCLIGGVFLTSFIGKVAGRGAFDRFVSSVRDMRVLPTRAAARSVARCVVTAEAAVCVTLATPVRAVAVGGFVLSGVLLTVFAAGILLSLRQGVRTPCRCFGASTSPLGPGHVARNLTLTAVAVTGAVAVPAAGPATPGATVLSVLAGLLLGGLTTALDDILDLFRPVDRAPGLARGR